MSDSDNITQAWTAPPVGSPCWLEINAVDVTACKTFYTSLFPSWAWRPSTDKHDNKEIAKWRFAGESGLSGGIVQVSAECKAAGEQKMGMGMTVYLFVESIEETQKRVEELGGETLSGKIKEGESGWYMYLKDVAGNRFGIYELQK